VASLVLTVLLNSGEQFGVLKVSRCLV